MSLFEFLLPEQAGATHLRDISEQLRHQRVTGASSADVRDLDARVQTLEEENALLTLLVVSLIKTVSERTDVTMKDVFDQLSEVDRLDGKQDGRIDPAAIRMMFGLEVGPAEDASEPHAADWTCGACNHRNTDRRSCLYCGASID